MPASKIVDHSEVQRWFEQGWTYQQMVDKYIEKYNIETTIAMWGNYRRRNGLDARNVWDVQVVPWKVAEQHRYRYAVLMLRRYARRKAGVALGKQDDHDLDVWIAGMERDGTVVHYDPDTEKGFFYVPRREGIDLGLIREPGRVDRRLPE